MIVRPVVSAVFMVVHMGITAVRVLMEVLEEMVMCVGMGMLVGVLHVPMRMFMRVRVSVLMPVYMFVFMFSFHNNTSFHRMWTPFMNAFNRTMKASEPFVN